MDTRAYTSAWIDHKKNKDFFKMDRMEKKYLILLMVKKYLDNRFIILYLIPFFIGALTTIIFSTF